MARLTTTRSDSLGLKIRGSSLGGRKDKRKGRWKGVSKAPPGVRQETMPQLSLAEFSRLPNFFMYSLI